MAENQKDENCPDTAQGERTAASLLAEVCKAFKSVLKIIGESFDELTITDDKEWPTFEKIVPTESARSIYRKSRIQKYFHSLDIINKDLHVSTAIRVAPLALPLLLREGPSCSM